MHTETLKNGGACVIGFVAGAASYLCVWLKPGMSNVILWLTLCILAGFLASFISDTKMGIALLSVVTGAFSLNVTQIVVDVANDPTSHNLFPFELAFTLLLTTVAAATGIGLARLAKHLLNYDRISSRR